MFNIFSLIKRHLFVKPLLAGKTACLAIGLVGALTLGGCGASGDSTGTADAADTSDSTDTADDASNSADSSDSEGASDSTDASGDTAGDASGASAAESEIAEDEAVSQDVFAMDTYMTVTAYGPNGPEAVSEAVDEINRLDSLLSTGDESSEIYRINSGDGSSLTEDTVYLISRSLELYESTDHAFNISVYPLMVEWGFTTGNYKVPSADTLTELLTYTDASKIHLDEENASVSFDLEGMQIDLGGITKGYTSGKIMDIYRECGVTSGLVNLGGNVQVFGTKPDGSAWRVGVQDPEDEESYVGAISVVDKAVITSGGYERYFEEDGVTYHHIIDPSTGYPADSGLTSVTIVSADGTLADGLSTSLFIMGKDKAVAYWSEHSDEFDMILMDENRKIYVSEGIADDFETNLECEIVTAE